MAVSLLASEAAAPRSAPVSDSGSPLLADEARRARQAALASVAAALPPWAWRHHLKRREK